MNMSFWRKKWVRKNDRILLAKVTIIQVILLSYQNLKSIHEHDYTRTICFYLHIRENYITFCLCFLHIFHKISGVFKVISEVRVVENHGLRDSTDLRLLFTFTNISA